MTPLRPTGGYNALLAGISELLERARHAAARSVNSVLTETYWEIGRRVVEYEQGGKARAEYGAELLARLSADLSAKHGRGFSERNLYLMRAFFLGWDILQTPSAKLEVRAIFPEALEENQAWKRPAPSCRPVAPEIGPTPSGKSDGEKSQTVSAELRVGPAVDRLSELLPVALAEIFPLSWSHYVRLMAVDKPQARAFYESEAIRGGWSIRQLDRQISTQFYERAVRSKRPAALLARNQRPRQEDAVPVEEEIRDPYLLEFLNLKDEYSEGQLEEALIRHLEWFLLEMGTGFAFVARQKRIRVGDSWYRVDLLLYHRGLRCLVVIELKTGAFSHADAGQTNLYLNYAKEHMTLPGEADPVGIILCTDKDDAVVKYATGGIRARVFASKYLTSLPDEETLRREILARRGEDR